MHRFVINRLTLVNCIGSIVILDLKRLSTYMATPMQLAYLAQYRTAGGGLAGFAPVLHCTRVTKGFYPCYSLCVSIIRSAETSSNQSAVEIGCLLRKERLKYALEIRTANEEPSVSGL